MRRLASASGWALVLLALGVALPASASATNRYASPADQGSGNCLSEANSCDLPTAVSGGANDDIFVRGDMGDYALSSLVTNASPIRLHGTRGRPRLIFSANQLRLEPGSSAENLYVETNGSGNAQLLGSTANNLITKHTGNRHAIFLEDSTLTNSIAWSPVGEQALELDGSNTLRNVTAYAPAGGADGILAFGRPPSSGSLTNTFVNVIARGGSGGAGILASQRDPVDLTLNVSYSNYSSTQVDPASDDASKVHFNLGTTNQTAAPVFANPGIGDFHQLLGSPTIDKGVNSVANGAADFDGGARTLNGTTDIGADEYIPGPVGGGGGGPAGGGGPTGGGGDTDSPEASLSGAKRQTLGRYVVVSVSSDETGTASASGTLSVPGASKTFRLKKASKAVTAGTRVKLRLKVPVTARRAAKRALKRGRRVKAKLSVAVADGAGNRDTAKRTVRLKR